MRDGWLHVREDDRDALKDLVDREAAADPAFSNFIELGRSAAAGLLSSAESLAPGGGDSNEELARKLAPFLDAEAAAAPFAAAAPLVLESLGRSIAGKPSADGAAPAELLGDWDSAAAQEVRALYRIALAVDAEPVARQKVVDLSAKGAGRELAANFPSISAMVSEHLDEYGWVRTVQTTLEPLTQKEVLQRIQIALLRWDRATIALAAGEPSADTPETPAEILPLVDAYRAVSEELAFNPGLRVKARWVARPFFDRLGEALGSTRLQLSVATSEEILSALTTGRGLPEGIDARGAGRAALTGQSVSLGRAVGRVRVILHADDGGKLQVGDILVTNLSTPTYEGEPSVFPYRTVPAVAVDKAGAIVTDEGGLLSHAAIICRENQVPCILGAEEASKTLADGMIVEADATRSEGTITILQP